ncbi:permease prefix domain 1-containing protein [Dactylosporangium sp. NBC_01737]|uniref:permease prefix domain 1-containing protein n=1 Tax=Dactylosporangium sp. NBC_01737 TaxID=2975959 RepID=UPI002E1622C3|nr:permease prefix domain 1-containing protein [Dactylosporangium sp. NBC_01737]
MTTGEGGSPVEEYLDEMFDRLAGTGAPGRRILAEAETHLLAAAEDGIASGLDPMAAEREAVARFGTATDIARQVRPAPAGLRVALRRLTVGAWAVTGAALAWYGASGTVTWLLGRPFAQLMIATDRFGSQRDMCERPWVPGTPGLDCAALYQSQLATVPAGGARFPFVVVALAGAALLAALFMARRWTALGTPAWTPAGPALRLAFAVPFGLVAALLLFYAALGAHAFMQSWTLSYATAGFLAGVISVVAARRSRRRAAPA